LSTIYQLKNKNKIKKKAHHRAPALKNCPQVKGTVRRPRIVTPRKPNSARRPVAKVALVNNKRVTAHLPGVGHNIRSHSAVLVRGGGARDLPGVRYTCVRGVYDFAGIPSKRRRRSIYGTKRPTDKIFKIRRKYRFS
jgi:small subunit ribosomal protein S12